MSNPVDARGNVRLASKPSITSYLGANTGSKSTKTHKHKVKLDNLDSDPFFPKWKSQYRKGYTSASTPDGRYPYWKVHGKYA